MKSFSTALKLLTIFPWPKRVEARPEEIGKSSPLFPLVGFCLGLILVLVDRLLEPYLASEILSVVLVTLLILMTRGQHLEGLRETFDELGLKDSREHAEKVLGDRRVGVLASWQSCWSLHLSSTLLR